MIKQYLKGTRYFIIALSLGIISCSNQPSELSPDVKTGVTNTAGANLGPKGGGSIDPKVRQGYTLIGVGKGSSNLTMKLKLTGDGMAAFLTKAETPAAPDISSVANEIGINGEKYKFDIPYGNLNKGEHEINLTGLEKGDVVNLDSKVYDKSNKVIGEQKVPDKKITKDDETVEVNIPVTINISNTNTNTNTQNQTNNQTVNVNAAPVINITLPSPPPRPTAPPMQTQPAATGGITGTSNTGTGTSGSTGTGTSACLQPDMNHLLTLPTGAKVQMCSPPDDTTDPVTTNCTRPDSNFQIVNGGVTYTLCRPGGK